VTPALTVLQLEDDEAALRHELVTHTAHHDTACAEFELRRKGEVERVRQERERAAKTLSYIALKTTQLSNAEKVVEKVRLLCGLGQRRLLTWVLTAECRAGHHP
jgi:hypothetical protein